MNDMPKIHDDDPWDTRELGSDEVFARKTSKENEKGLDDKLGLQIISIRLQKSLIDELKELAGEDGLGYQPYIRQVLSHHVRNEKIKKEKQHIQLIRK